MPAKKIEVIEVSTQNCTCICSSNNRSVQTNRESIGGLWRDFRESSSLHGLYHISAERTICRGTIWLLLVIGMGVSLTITLNNFRLEYYTYPSLTKLSVHMAKELLFPAVTVCNMSPYKMSKVKNDDAVLEYLKRQGNMGPFLPKLNFSDDKNKILFEDGEADWIENVSFSVKELFIGCKFKKDLYFDCGQIFKPLKTELGICFTFNGFQESEPLTTHFTGSILGLQFYVFVNQAEYVYARNMGAGIKVAIHEHHEEPDMLDSGYLISPGFTTYLAMRQVQYKLLPPPFKAFEENYCIETRNVGGFGNNGTFNSYTGCIHECKAKYAYDKCHCRSHRENGNRTPICSFERDYTCHGPAREEFDGDLDLQSKCLCPMSCYKTEFETRVSTASFPANLYEDWVKSTFGYDNLRENTMEVRIYYESMVYKKYEQTPKISYLDILGTIGGHMGIFLGASVLTISELFELLFMSFIIFCKKFFRSKNQKCSPSTDYTTKKSLAEKELNIYSIHS